MTMEDVQRFLDEVCDCFVKETRGECWHVHFLILLNSNRVCTKHKNSVQAKQEQGGFA